MPYCAQCDKFWNPNSLAEDGACLTCGRVLEAPAPKDEQDDYKAPWHFKLLVVITVVYLGWRILQLLNILPRNF